MPRIKTLKGPLKIGIYLPAALVEKLSETNNVTNFSQFIQKLIENEIDGANSARVAQFIVELRKTFVERWRQYCKNKFYYDKKGFLRKTGWSPVLGIKAASQILERAAADAWNEVLKKEWKT